MTVERIRELYEAQPFQPFVMHMVDGRKLPVVRREFLSLSPSGRTVVIFQPDDSCNIVDLLLVTDLELGLPRGVRRKPRSHG